MYEIKADDMSGTRCPDGSFQNAIKNFGRKTWSPNSRWEDDIKIDSVRGHGLDSSGSEKGPVAGICEQSSKPPGYIKGEEFIYYLNDCQLLKKDSAAWS
jgi:hypothetical protein